MRWLTVLFLGLLLNGGCTFGHLERYLIAREGESCIYLFGFLTPFVSVRAITATGGLPMDDCLAAR